jgi:hypothetical protein
MLKESMVIDFEALRPKKPGTKPQDRLPAGELEMFFSSRGITMKGLAAAIGVSPSAVWQWFRERGVPANRMSQLEEVKRKVELWELKNRKIFPG